jgi:hypothetical protein
LYPGRVTLFGATQQDAWMLKNLEKVGVDVDDPTYGWGALAAAVDTFNLPGNHDQICNEPHVKLLAKHMRASIDKALLPPPLGALAGPEISAGAESPGTSRRTLDRIKKALLRK